MWFEDVELIAPTFVNTYSDERKLDGIFSKPLTTISTFLNEFRNTPLAPYTTPFSMIGTGVAKVLGLFGYAKPVVMEHNVPILNQTMNALGLLDGRYAGVKLANFNNQGVAITSDGAGIGTDEDMILSRIFEKWGFYHIFQYPSALAATAFVAKFPIGVALNHAITVVAANSIEPTPISFVAAMFEAYRGSVVLKFQSVASNFHRGQLHFFFVPNLNIEVAAAFPADPTYDEILQTCTGVIMDVNGTTECELECPFVKPMPAISVGTLQTVASVTTFSDFLYQGMVYVYAVNPLGSAGSTSAVPINVFIKGGKDFIPFRPSSVDTNNFALTITTYSDESKRIYGEEVTTIKQLLNKSTLGFTAVTTPAANSYLTLDSGYYDPTLPAPFHPAVGGFTFHPTLMEWLCMPFVGRTGSTRITYLPTSTVDGVSYVVPGPYNAVQMAKSFVAAPWVLPALSNPASPFNDLLRKDYYAFGYNKIHPGIDAELPIRLPYYYYPTLTATTAAGSFTFKTNSPTTNTSTTLSYFFSGGDDFSLHFWRGVPRGLTS